MGLQHPQFPLQSSGRSDGSPRLTPEGRRTGAPGPIPHDAPPAWAAYPLIAGALRGGASLRAKPLSHSAVRAYRYKDNSFAMALHWSSLTSVLSIKRIRWRSLALLAF